MPDYADIMRLAADARLRIAELSPSEARDLVQTGALLIDVRDDEELLRNPPIGGAVHLSRGRLEFLVPDIVAKDATLILYCAGGNRGALAAESLGRLGYDNVFNLRGGLHAWRLDAGQPWIPGHSWAA